MKVILFNGSPNSRGCTYLALREVEKTLNAEGIETELLQIGNKPVRDCIGCGKCRTAGKCVFDDIVSEWTEKAAHADGFVFGSPVYYAHPAGAMLSAMDRMFYSCSKNFSHKPATAVVTARRAGTAASLDAMMKHFTISEMPVVSSTYWNMVFGPVPSLVEKDEEGLQTMRNIGHNMAWLLKCIEAGKKNGIEVPDSEKGKKTNFNL